MGNKVSDLTGRLDSALQDLAQMTGKIDYGNIIDFSNKSTKKQQQELSLMFDDLSDLHEGGDEKEIDELETKIANIVKSSK